MMLFIVSERFLYFSHFRAFFDKFQQFLPLPQPFSMMQRKPFRKKK